MPTSAYAYLRVSGQSQVQGDGFTRQLAAIKQYAASHDVKLSTQVFRDKGVSGTKESMDRPAWTTLIQALHGNGVKLVLVEKLDRIARDLMVQEATIAYLQKHGFQLISVAEPDLCIDDPSRKLMRQIMGAFAEYEKTMLVLKLRGARARIRARGERCDGAKPYGTLDGEQAILERIKTLRAAGNTFVQVADTLNDDGIAPRRGERWHAGVLYRLVKSAE